MMDRSSSGSGHSRAVAIPGSDSSGSPRGQSPRSLGWRSGSPPLHGYGGSGHVDPDDEDAAGGGDAAELWAPIEQQFGTPIPPATTGWWGKKTAVKDYAPRRARSVAGSPASAIPATALPSSRTQPRSRKPRFQEYWPQAQLDAGLAAGTVVRGTIRVNATDRSQAYLTVDGFSADILIKGPAQNRAVEGDEVAVELLPPEQWHHMRGGPLPQGDLAPLAPPSPVADPLPRRPSFRSSSQSGALGRNWSLGSADSGSGSGSGGLLRRHSHTTPVPSIQEGILDNDAIEEGDEEVDGSPAANGNLRAANRIGVGGDDSGLDFTIDLDEPSPVRRRTPEPAASSRPGRLVGRLSEALRRSPASKSSATAAAVLDRPQSQPSTLQQQTAAAERVFELPAFTGGLSQALASSPVPTTPLSISWEGVGTGSRQWAGLDALRGQPLPRIESGGTPHRRLGTASSSALLMRAPPSSVSSARSVASSLGSLDEEAVLPRPPQTEAMSPAALAAAISRLLEADPHLRVTGQVVSMLRPSRRRKAVVGVLREEGAIPGRSGGVLFLVPRDSRLPRSVVQPSALPDGRRSALMREAARPLDADSSRALTLVCASIEDWDTQHAFPAAKVHGIVGAAGDLACETQALLTAESAPDSSDFPAEVLADLPTGQLSITDADLAQRRDLRSKRIFSIDPPTARDLDDALSVQRLLNGDMRIGVHIADVSHFVRPGTALDKEAKQRGTSVYLMDRVIPMLPRRLCEELCSLNAGTARLTFSVIWDLSLDGEIRSQWMGRTVINSCAKLAYGHAQAVIDGTPPAESPAELHGGHTWEQVQEDIRLLHAVAQRRRAGRQAAGALRLDNTKLSFQLDEAGLPVSCAPYQQREANQLVEEFMLLANISVATSIAFAFPDQALLRRHPSPGPRKLAAAAAAAKDAGIKFDTTSSGALAASLRALAADPEQAELSEVLQLLFTKPMQVAQYFSTGDVKEEAWRHYALAVSRYTHFTSPIRRYPDVVVHRLLDAALRQQQQQSPSEVPELPHAKEVSDIARHCNDTKASAKAVQDACTKLYLGALLRRQPAIAEAVVTSVNGGAWFDVYMPRFGHEGRLFVADMPGVSSAWNSTAKTLTLSAEAPAARSPFAASPAAHGASKTGGGGGGGGLNPQDAIAAARVAAAAALASSPSLPKAAGSKQASSRGGGRPSATATQTTAVQTAGAFREATSAVAKPAAAPSSSVSAGTAAAEPSNEAGLQPLALPVQLRNFSKVPVILSAAGSSGATARLGDISVRLYLPS